MTLNQINVSTTALHIIELVKSLPAEDQLAIREALLSGDKLKAIKLYRSVYGVGLKEAQDALNAM